MAKQTAADDGDNNVPDVQPKQLSISSTSTSVRDTDQPLTVKWAASLQNQKQLKQKQPPNPSLSQGFISNAVDSPESLNYNADYSTAQTIVNDELGSLREI
ncbi:MAG TPA: hypothetical protein VI278_17655 [Nitrososphaeraceae archaeon]